MTGPGRPAWLREELYPFDSHVAEVETARVHYVDEGSGPPLLLLHGNPTWSFLYREVIKGLRDRFRCIPPTTPASASPGRRPATATRPPSTPSWCSS